MRQVDTSARCARPDPRRAPLDNGGPSGIVVRVRTVLRCALAALFFAGCGATRTSDAVRSDCVCPRPEETWVHMPFSIEPGEETRGPIVDDLVAALRARRNVVRVRVEGHPLCEPSDMRTSARVAEEVAGILAARGVARDMIDTVGYGSGRCGLCPCLAQAEEKACRKCSMRCGPPTDHRGDVRTEFSILVRRCNVELPPSCSAP